LPVALVVPKTLSLVPKKGDQEKLEKKQAKEKANNLLVFAPGSCWKSLDAEAMEAPEPSSLMKKMQEKSERNLILLRNSTNTSLSGHQEKRNDTLMAELQKILMEMLSARRKTHERARESWLFD
jgi:hypothetical protein